MMGIMIKGMGFDHVCWGSDAVWTGSPQWQIEALRRLEIPEDMQKKYGFKPLGPADGPIKTAVLGGNNAQLYGIDPNKRTDIGPNRDRFARMKEEYERNGPARSNLRYGYVRGARRGRLVGIHLSDSRRKERLTTHRGMGDSVGSYSVT
jgi:hypothetical protein